MATQLHCEVLIIGCGKAGLSVASRLQAQKSGLKLGIIEPSGKHNYQPAWTLVGGGEFDVADSIKMKKISSPLVLAEFNSAKEQSETFPFDVARNAGACTS
jgi:sulfide:quinone oxidoreductase